MLVKLKDIIEGIEMQSEDSWAFLNKETREIVYVSEEALGMAEDGEEPEDLPEWEQDELELAYEIIDESENFIQLPSPNDIDEYKMVENFCNDISDSKIKDALFSSIKGKGAFRRFKENLERFGLIDAWYEYRENEYKKIAAEFCESHHINYIY